MVVFTVCHLKAANLVTKNGTFNLGSSFIITGNNYNFPSTITSVVHLKDLSAQRLLKCCIDVLS